MQTLLSIAAYVAMAVAALLFLYVALLVTAVRFGPPTPAETEILAVHHQQVEHETRVLLDPDIRALLEMGFEWRGWLAAPAEHAVGAVLVDPAAGDCASVMLMQGVRYVDVARIARSGRRVTTTNVEIVPLFLPHPARHTARFPHVKDVARLVRLHRAVVRAEGLHPPFDLPPVGREAEWLAREVGQTNREQVQTGLFREDGGQLHRTWKAAVRGVWLLSPQTVGWHRRRQEAQSRAAEAALLRAG